MKTNIRFEKRASESEILDLIAKANEYQLEGLEIIDKYSLAEISKIYNGIGPDRMNEKIRDFITICNKTPLPAVLIHDLQYDFGGNKEDFRRSNRQLFHNLRKITKICYKCWNPFRWIQWIRCWYFYRFCKAFGFEGWNHWEHE